MLTNLLALLISLVIPYIITITIYKIVRNVLTPGKEWLELSAIFIGILTIYLINEASINLSNKIKLVCEGFNEKLRKKDERIKELEKIIHENKIILN